MAFMLTSDTVVIARIRIGQGNVCATNRLDSSRLTCQISSVVDTGNNMSLQSTFKCIVVQISKVQVLQSIVGRDKDSDLGRVV